MMLLLMAIVMVIYLNELVRSFSSGFLSDVCDDQKNDDVRVNDDGKVDTNSGSGSIFDQCFYDEVT